jgi:trehalose synthase
MVSKTETESPALDGVVYSKRKNFCPFSTPSLEDYVAVIGEEKAERLAAVAERLKGLMILELNSTAQGGGVAEMLYSSVPFLNLFDIQDEWKTIHGNKEYFECTKSLHNLLQGMEGQFTPEMERIYFDNLLECVNENIIDYRPDVVMVHDPQPLGLIRYLKKPRETWLWRCHIDIEEAPVDENSALWDFVTMWAKQYHAAIFSANHYVVSRWPLPKIIIPPFIDPLSEKNRELTREEINTVLTRYNIDPEVPIIAQVGRFDPWKGIDRTIATYRLVRQETNCQLILAGGLASDDPEGEKILAKIYDMTEGLEDVHILELDLADRLQNYLEVNALQRAATVIMQPSTKEGFGLVITEALWKAKPVIAADVGAIPLQIRDGDTGYFYSTSGKTARRVIHLLKNPRAASALGERGKKYVEEHFLMPDRIADYLMAIEMTLNGNGNHKIPDDSIVSFHSWFKLSKRSRPR